MLGLATNDCRWCFRHPIHHFELDPSFSSSLNNQHKRLSYVILFDYLSLKVVRQCLFSYDACSVFFSNAPSYNIFVPNIGLGYFDDLANSKTDGYDILRFTQKFIPLTCRSDAKNRPSRNFGFGDFLTFWYQNF
jgi:hypothetical protein